MLSLHASWLVVGHAYCSITAFKLCPRTAIERFMPALQATKSADFGIAADRLRVCLHEVLAGEALAVLV